VIATRTFLVLGCEAQDQLSSSANARWKVSSGWAPSTIRR
jgi:hypothetical protein